MQGAANNVKFQVVRLMRMLVQICQTLDYVPPEVRQLHSTIPNANLHLLTALQTRSLPVGL